VRSVQLTTYFLEMLDRTQLRPRRVAGADFRVERSCVPCPELNRFLYCAVGWQWYWIDRLVWTYPQWQAYVDRPQVQTWIGYWQSSPAGYFELEQQADGNTELAYFGLLPQFIGRGLGANLLTNAIERAWDWGARRVWVHTCTLDHPSALANYQARGFRLYKEEVTQKSIPDTPERDWP
jgi:GNAT superfamily N-acetyltransferase